MCKDSNLAVDNIEVSVLMSVYIKEKAEYLVECFESLLAQTILAKEWVIVEDGPLTIELYSVLDEYQKKYPTLIKRVPLKKNMGLGLALKEGIKNCSCELIARMDTDDICVQKGWKSRLQNFKKTEI